VSVTDSSRLVGTIDAPWALDAKKAPVPTSYDVSGDRLIQHVGHNAQTSYPVVADPDVSYCTWGGFVPAACIKYSRSETEAAYDWIAVSAFVNASIATLCGFIPQEPWYGRGSKSGLHRDHRSTHSGLRCFTQ